MGLYSTRITIVIGSNWKSFELEAASRRLLNFRYGAALLVVG